MEAHRIPAMLQQAEPADPWGKLFCRSLKLLFEEHGHHRARLQAIETAVLDLSEVVRSLAKQDADRIAALQGQIREARAAQEAEAGHLLDMAEDLANAASLVLSEGGRRQDPR